MKSIRISIEGATDTHCGECPQLEKGLVKTWEQIDYVSCKLGFGNYTTRMREMGDVRAAMIMLCESGYADKQIIHDNANAKIFSVGRWLHFQEHSHDQ